jgi:cytochrome c553
MNALLKTLGLALVLTVTASAGDYDKCVSCHGAAGEKVALGKSKVIKDMTKAEIAAALNGYKDGSYGGVSKALMKGQVDGLSDAQITSIADQIGK